MAHAEDTIVSILLLLIPLAILLGGSALIGFLFAARGGQFDDLETPALRALIDETERNLDRNESRKP
jgi:cbb3-type cytochrome oxidase maturation protein